MVPGRVGPAVTTVAVRRPPPAAASVAGTSPSGPSPAPGSEEPQDSIEASQVDTGDSSSQGT